MNVELKIKEEKMCGQKNGVSPIHLPTFHLALT
jgi:hypothetical protein